MRLGAPEEELPAFRRHPLGQDSQGFIYWYCDSWETTGERVDAVEAIPQPVAAIHQIQLAKTNAGHCIGARVYGRLRSQRMQFSWYS